MVKKHLINRSSKQIAVDALSKSHQAVQLLQEALGTLTAISEAEYKSLRKIADKLKRETDDVFMIIKNHPKLVDAPLSIEEMEKDKACYEFCDTLRAPLSRFMVQLDREQNIAGAEYFNSTTVFEADVASKAVRGEAEAQHAQVELNLIVRNRTGGKIAKKNKPTT